MLCIDDPVVRDLLPEVTRQVITYGFAQDADYRIADMSRDGLTTGFECIRPALQHRLQVKLNMPGTHNVLNATAAIAVACDEGLEDLDIQRGLAAFAGVGRRFTQLGEIRLPVERADWWTIMAITRPKFSATLESARQAWPERRIVMVYQPHRYTRTRDLYEDFVAVLSSCDVLVLLDVYAAGEEPIPGADSRSLTRSIRQRGQMEPIFAEHIEDVPELLATIVDRW